MRTPFLLIVMIVGSMLTSCKKDENNPVTPTTLRASEYFIPLSTGNSTRLTGATTTRMDTLAPTVSPDTTMYTILATTSTSTGGKALRGLQIYSSGSGTENEYVYASDTELTRFDSSRQEANASTLLKMPIQIGVPWRITPTDTALFVITSVTETVTTPVGVFSNCIKISRHQSDAPGMYVNVDMYVAKGVGIVRTKVDKKFSLGQFIVTAISDKLLSSKNF